MERRGTRFCVPGMLVAGVARSLLRRIHCCRLYVRQAHGSSICACTREPPDQALSNLTSAPTGVLALHVQDKVLHLERKLMSLPIGTSAPIGEPLNSTLLVAVEDLVAGLAGDPELPAEFRHRLAG